MNWQKRIKLNGMHQGLFDKVTGEIQKKPFVLPQAMKYQDVFGYSIIELAEKNDKIVGITPAMPSGCSLKYMMEKMPERAFDVGIRRATCCNAQCRYGNTGHAVYSVIYILLLCKGHMIW
jgi:1-deoxy-D-xylulose-5-phosphate synthase